MWVAEVLRLVATGSTTRAQSPSGPGSVVARGVPFAPLPPSAVLEVIRVVTPYPHEESVVGVVTIDRGCLAVVHAGV